MFIFFSFLILSVTADCTNCEKCEGSACTKCKDNYMLLGESCVEGNTILEFCEEYHTDRFGCKKCQQGYTPTAHGLCAKCNHVFGPDCLQCDPTSSEKCTECRSGAVLTREGACIVCSKYFRSCSECDGQTMRCTKCNNGKKPTNGFC